MGAGKSTVGRLVADAMNTRFVDLDRAIELEAGASIAGIFERHGEETFRRLESRALERVAEEPGVVVATGGGIMTSAPNRKLMERSGTTVWLNPPFDAIVERLARDPEGGRPLFTDVARARELFESRLPDYRRAEVEVAVAGDESAAAVAARVARLVRGEPCAT